MTPKQIEKREWELKEGIVLPPSTGTLLKGYKEPLTHVMQGWGYIGTIAYNVDCTHTQCHICGYFFKGLPWHVMKTHDMEIREYKDRFSIMRSTSLMPPRSPMKQNHALVKATAAMTPEQKVQRLDNLRKGWERGTDARLETMESKNKKGRCPEQLLRRVLILSEELQKTPTRREFIAKHGDGGDLLSIYRTFGNWSGVIRELGLTPNKIGRPSYVLRPAN